MQRPALEVKLDTDDLTTLLWADGFYLKSSVPIVGRNQVVGTLLVEQPLDRIKPSQELGDTSEVRICILRSQRLLCLPDRNHPKVYETDFEGVHGKATPMSFAVSGKTGVFKGLDYRDVNVVAAYGPFTNTGLGIVIKKGLIRMTS